MLLEWLGKYRVNEYSDFLGLVITIIGFAFTLRGLWRSRKTAEKALDIAEKVRDDLHKVDTVDALSRTIAAMEELKRMHRKSEFDSLPERYSSLRRTLIGIRSSATIFTQNDQALMQRIVSQLVGFEKNVEACIAKRELEKINFLKMNQHISSAVDEVHVVLIRIKAEIGGKS